MADNEKESNLESVKPSHRRVEETIQLSDLKESNEELSTQPSPETRYASSSESSDDDKILEKLNSFSINPTCPSEDWMKLQLGEEYEVCVCNFGSCSSFFIQVINENDAWDELTKKLDDMKDDMELEFMEDVDVGKMCLVESEDEDMNRAKIIRHSEQSTLCFCVDTAEMIYFHKEPPRVYEIPADILNMMPFQAVNCRLMGVKVPHNNFLTDLIYKKIIRRICQQRIRPLKKMDHNPEMIPWGLGEVQSYEVELFSRDENGFEGSTVNDLVVAYQLADKI